jgi:hypothetical protein
MTTRDHLAHDNLGFSDVDAVVNQEIRDPVMERQDGSVGIVSLRTVMAVLPQAAQPQVSPSHPSGADGCRRAGLMGEQKTAGTTRARPGSRRPGRSTVGRRSG